MERKTADGQEAPARQHSGLALVRAGHAADEDSSRDATCDASGLVQPLDTAPGLGPRDDVQMEAVAGSRNDPQRPVRGARQSPLAPPRDEWRKC